MVDFPPKLPMKVTQEEAAVFLKSLNEPGPTWPTTGIHHNRYEEPKVQIDQSEKAALIQEILDLRKALRESNLYLINGDYYTRRNHAELVDFYLAHTEPPKRNHEET